MSLRMEVTAEEEVVRCANANRMEKFEFMRAVPFRSGL